jgi:hypothetical protein
MGVEWVSRWDELTGLARDWNALARGVPFRAWAWLEAWWRHYGNLAHCCRQLFVLAVYDRQNKLAGLAPWYRESTTNQGHIVRFLGSGDVCSDYLSILSSPGREADVALALADWLCGDSLDAGRGAWSTLAIGGVDAADKVMQCFIAAMQDRGSLICQQPGPNCWRINLPATWDDYLATLSKSHRKQLRRLQRRLFDSGRATLHVVDDAHALGRGLANLTELHQRRRQALGQESRFADERFAAFHREVASQLLEQGHLRLAWVELDAHPVAAEYQVTGTDVVYAYQSGIDPAALEFEPGRLVMMATLERAIAEGFRAFDLLRGDEPYKPHWRAQPRPSVQVTILPGRGTDWLKHGALVAQQQVRAWLKAGWNLAAVVPQQGRQ